MIRPARFQHLSRFLSLIALLVPLLASGQAADRPNIVVIFSDDQGMNDVGSYGSEIPTPNIDSIAENGIRFTDFYVAAPVCTPSRYGLLTGHFPARSRDQLLGPLMFLEAGDKTRGMQKGEFTIAEALQKGGYRTALFGKWHLGHGDKKFLPTRFGFETFIGHTGGCIDYFTMTYGIQADWYHGERHISTTGYATDLITDHAVRFIEAHNESRPFFLYLPYNAPHFSKGYNFGKQETSNTLQAKPEDLNRFPDIKDLPRKYFAAMVANLDDNVGRILLTLHKKKMIRNTLVIFTCDNGGDPVYGGSNLPFRGVKKEYFEGGIRVPCVVQWPGRIKPGQVVNHPAYTLDFFPTFCGLAGIEAKRYQPDGADIRSLLFHGIPPKRDLLWQGFTERALRRGDWKYLRQDGKDMLFNLARDPMERTDLAGKETSKLAELMAAQAAVAKTFPTSK